MPDRYDIVVVGAGQAGLRACEGARTVSPDARILLIGDEPRLPYERPPLSKAGFTGGKGRELRDSDFYSASRIELRTGCRVDRIDRASRSLVTSCGGSVCYERLVLATGSANRMLDLPDAPVDRLHYLRTIEDAERLHARLEGGEGRLGVIGAGFIGLEVAAAARGAGWDVTLWDAAPRVLSRALPQELSQPVYDLHLAQGVSFRLGRPITTVNQAGDGGIRISSGDQRGDYDAVLIGIGVLPNTALASGAGLTVDDGIVVDEYGTTSDPGIFAAGEVTRHPLPGRGRVRLESWQVAELQGYCAGQSAAGRATAFRATPWLWSDQYGVNFQFLGDLQAQGRTLHRGMPGAPGSTAFRLSDDGQVLGAMAVDAGRDIAGARRLMDRDIRPDPALLTDSSAAWPAILKSRY